MQPAPLPNVTPLAESDLDRRMTAAGLAPEADDRAPIAYGGALLLRMLARLDAMPIAGEAEPAHQFTFPADGCRR
jgi:hypothetical protein